MTQEIVLRSTRRRRGRATRVWFVLALLLGSGWSLLWVLARQQAVQSMDAWLATEAGQGRPWSCPNREVSGFPFRFTLSCTMPTFTARIGGELVQGQVGGLHVEASLMRPNSVRVILASPMTARLGEEVDAVEISWSALSVEIGMTLAAEVRADANVEALDIIRPDQPKAHVDHAGLQLATAALSGSSQHDYRVATQLAGIAIPELDDATGNAAPLALDATATITALTLEGLDPWHDVAERWRLAGGRIELSSLTCAKAPLSVAARGQLGLDDLHRPTGLLQATVTGYESLADRLGLPLRAVSFGGALAGLLNGPAKTPAPAAEPGRAAITLPLALSGGRFAIGPFKTALRLAPIY